MRPENKLLLELVQECIRYGFNEKEALKFIEIKLGRPLSQRHYYRIKKFVQSDPAINMWLSNFARVGFALQHKERIEEIEALLKKAWRFLIMEENKADSNKFLILKLYGEIRELNKRLTELCLGTPVVAQIKAQLDVNANANSNNNNNYNNNNSNGATGPGPSAIQNAKANIATYTNTNKQHPDGSDDGVDQAVF